MTDIMDLFVYALNDFDIGNLKEAIKTITTIIDSYKNSIAETDKKIVIRCLQYRLQANFDDENYKDTLTDLKQLKNLGFNVRDNEILNPILIRRMEEMKIIAEQERNERLAE
ncbi:unnamed protein product [Rotaria sp. Silwood2]|nr:unnamed protein product [Rotaria sp. Silwood2]CAF4074674.1 unnamed protein product [Rotaria sp. Silwood2]